MGMFKVLIILALLIGAFWYFMPAKFNDTVDMIKSKIGMGDKTPTTAAETTTGVSEQNLIDGSTQTTTQTTQTENYDGYCIINGTCEFVATEQCPDMMYETRAACELDIEITRETETGYDYLGKPVTANGDIYSCKTDSDCRYDLSLCEDEYCQCDYSSGECYLR